MRSTATIRFKQWRRAALLKERTRREIISRVNAGDPVEAVAKDFDVPPQFVAHLGGWQLFKNDIAPTVKPDYACTCATGKGCVLHASSAGW